MNSNNERLTIEMLLERLSVYRSKKPDNSIESIGMTFTTINNVYFFDTGTGKVFKMDKSVEVFMKQLLSGKNDASQMKQVALEEGLNIAEILGYIEAEDLLKGTDSDKLYNKEFLEIAEKQQRTKCKQLILELTGACNLRCKYCIYSSSEKGIREFNSKNMKKETIVKAIDYIRKNGDDTVYVSFYGGEPLICFESLKYAIDYARESITDKELYFGFTTNLTLMTRDKAEYLAHVPNLSIICSIDGPEEIHDLNRIYIDGSGTYKDAIHGLKVLKEEIDKAGNDSITVSFNSVYMVPYKREKLKAIDDNFQELCKVTKNSSYSMSYPTNGTIPKEYEASIPPMGDSSMWEWMADMAKKCDSLENLKIRGVIDALVSIHDRLLTERALCSIPMNSCCVPGTRRLYIDTEGDMYVCERINKSPKIGNLDSGLDLNTIMSKYYYEYSDVSIKHCANCWAAKMCPFCYADRMTEDGISENAHNNCAQARIHLKSRFSLYHELLESCPQKLEILNEYIEK